MLLSKGRNTNPNFSLYDIFTSVFTTILAFVIFAKISPTLALVGQQSDIFKPVTAIENIFIKEPVVNQKTKLSPPTQEVINNPATQNKTEEKVKKAYNINSIKTHPKVIDVPQETIRPNDSILSKPLGVESDKTRTKTVDTPRDIETPAKNYEPAFLHNIEDQSKALRSEESKNDINKPDNKPGRARELLTNVKDSSQKAISIVGAVADDKSEKIERKVTNTFVEFGGSLKDSANKLCDKAGSGKDSVKNRVGGLYSSLKRRIN